MADEKFKISGLNAALDEYLSKIDKVNLSRESLLANQKLLEDCIRLSDSLDSKIKAIESSGASAGEKSARAGLLSQIKTTALSGGSVDSLLRQEARAVDLTRRGTAASSFPSLSLSERDDLQSLSAGINKSGLGSTFSQVSPAQLRPLLDWSSRSGSAPSRRSMMSYMQESTFSLGSGLDSRIGGDSDHLVTELAAEDRQEKFEDAVATIESTSDAILAALGKQRGGTNITVEASKPKKPKKDHGSWWSTLKLRGGIAGTAGALYGILSIPKVQDWIKKNIIDPDGRNDLFSKITSIWDKVTSIWDKVVGATTSPQDAAFTYADTRHADYVRAKESGSLTSDMSDEVSAVYNQLSSSAPVKLSGIADNTDTLFNKYAAGAMGDMVKAALGGVAVYKLGRVTMSVAQLALAVARFGPASALLVPFVGLGWSLWKAHETAKMREAFNIAALELMFKEGTGGAYMFVEGDEVPTWVSLAQLEGADGNTFFSSMSESQKWGTAFGQAGELAKVRRNSMTSGIIDQLLKDNYAFGDLAGFDSSKTYDSPEARSEAISRAFLSLSPEEQDAYADSHLPLVASAFAEGSIPVVVTDPNKPLDIGEQGSIEGRYPVLQSPMEYAMFLNNLRRYVDLGSSGGATSYAVGSNASPTFGLSSFLPGISTYSDYYAFVRNAVKGIYAPKNRSDFRRATNDLSMTALSDTGNLYEGMEMMRVGERYRRREDLNRIAVDYNVAKALESIEAKQSELSAKLDKALSGDGGSSVVSSSSQENNVFVGSRNPSSF